MELAFILLVGGITVLMISSLLANASNKDETQAGNLARFSVQSKSIEALFEIVKAQQAQIDELKKRLADSPKS